MELKERISDYKDFPKKGILFRDFSPILKDPAALSFVVDEFSKPDFTAIDNVTESIGLALREDLLFL